MNEDKIFYLNIDIRWQVCWTPPVKLEADLALVEEDGGRGHHGQHPVQAVVSSHLPIL